MDPFEVENLRMRIFQVGRWRNLYRVAHLAIAAFEIAFFDLIGKACDKPVYDLLGGAVRREISLYGYVVTDEPAAMAAQAKELVENGFGTLYMKGAWSRERDQRVLAAIRDAIGPRPRIRVDGNEALSPAEAVSWVKALEGFDLEFVEQPTPAIDLEGMRRVREASSIPVAANQGLWSSEEIVQVIRSRAADIIVTGPLWVGGLLALKKAAAIATAAGMPFCRHAPPEGGIATAAGLHVLATLPQLMDGNQIYLGAILTQDVVAGSPPSFERGRLRVPDGPGLGIEIDEDELDRLTTMYERQGDFAQWDERVLA
jgi:L-alanine-DL-glutamate epimerase-like enolase superfamily enzyme